jgi:O-antigen ligase
MQNHDSYTLPAGWFDLLFMLGMIAVCLFKIHDPLFLFGVLSALFLLWKWRKNPLRFSWIDKAMTGILLYQILHIFFSVEPVSGVLTTKTLVFSAVFYFLLRTGINTLPRIERFLLVCCIFIALLCTVALITFLLFRSTCAYVEFSGLYDFRHLYKPLGYLSNVWGSLLIGFTGIVLLSLHTAVRQNRTKFIFILITLSLLLWNMVVSFSRGVYLSFAFLLLLYLFFLIFVRYNRKRKTYILIALIVPVLAAGFIQKDDVIKTLQFNKSLSQQRSISSRIKTMSFSYELFRKSPVTGYGSGTYPQVINEYRYEDDHNDFTNFAPNGYTQLLIEQGILGFSLWGILFVAILVMIFKRRKDTPAAIITLSVLVALLIREATFPVFLESGGFQLLFFTMLAVFQNTLSSVEIRISTKYTRYFPVTISGIAVLFCACSIYHMTEEQNNRKALSAIKAGDPEMAEKYVNKTLGRTPCLINRSIIYRKLYAKTKDFLYLNKAEECLNKAALKNPYDTMITYYRASVMREKKENEAALRILTELVEKFPNKSLYQWEMFDLLYNSNQQENSLKYLLQAVKLSPGLLDRSHLKNILSKDTVMNNSLKNDLLHDVLIETSADDPVHLAKKGKICYVSGYEKEAGQHLQKAILLLPNLIFPHYYLYKIETNQNNSHTGFIYLKQFVFLSSGIISEEMIGKTIHSGEIEKLFIAKEDFTDNSYAVKFQAWYHSSIVF